MLATYAKNAESWTRSEFFFTFEDFGCINVERYSQRAKPTMPSNPSNAPAWENKIRSKYWATSIWHHLKNANRKKLWRLTVVIQQSKCLSTPRTSCDKNLHFGSTNTNKCSEVKYSLKAALRWSKLRLVKTNSTEAFWLNKRKMTHSKQIIKCICGESLPLMSFITQWKPNKRRLSC